MGDQVEVVTQYGQRGTVDAADLPTLQEKGGRLATPQELAAERLQDRYDALSTGDKLLYGATGAALPPTLEALKHGAAQGLTAGLGEGLTRQALTAWNPEVGKSYEEHIRDQREAHGTALAVGEVAGVLGSVALTGGLGGAARGATATAARAAPAALIGAAGNAAERVVARQVATLATKGTLGRAGAAAASLGAQGAVEGALFSAGHEYGEQLLGDHELNAEKIFAAAGMGAIYGGAGGAVLGGAGSLVKSGVSAVTSAARPGLARAVGRAELQAEETVARAATKEATDAGAAVSAGAPPKTVAAAIEDTATSETRRVVRDAAESLTPKEIAELRKTVAGTATTGARGAADDLAFSALGTTRKVADKIGADVEGGTRAVGNYVNRRILTQAEGESWLRGTFNAAKGGRADDLVPLIATDKAKIGMEIGDLVKANDTAVSLSEFTDIGHALSKKLAQSSATIDAAGALTARVEKMTEAFKNRGVIAADGTIPLSAMYYERAALESAAHEAGRMGSKSTKEAIQAWMREVDTSLLQKLDDTAKGLGRAGDTEKLLGLKREYQLAASALKAAEDGADRIAGNNVFGIREGIGATVGFATGNPLFAIAAGVGGKLARERGAAAGAYLLRRLSDTNSIARAVAAVDDTIARAAKGVLLPAAKGTQTAARSEPLAARANRVITAVRAAQADPEATAAKLLQHSANMSHVAPKTAESYVATVGRALDYIAKQLPTTSIATNNPLRDTDTPRLSALQQAKIARLGEYVEEPLRFFEDVERGMVSPEGVGMVRIMMPKLFAEFQERTLSAIIDQRAKGKPIPYEQRLKLSMLLDIQGDASVSPDMINFLQSNVAGSASESEPPAQAPKGPVNLETPQSTFDRIESR